VLPTAFSVDTLGIATPEAVEHLVGSVRGWLGPEIPIHFHGHNDYGMATANTVAAVEMRFLDREDGAVVVQGPDERIIAVLPPGTNGFARGVLRGLARERRQHHLDSGPTFRLVRWADGRLSLEDPATGRHVNLEAFGPTNARVFADLLVSAQTLNTEE